MKSSTAYDSIRSIAHVCALAGASTLVLNLLTSKSELTAAERDRLRGWEREYGDGLPQEVFEVPAPSQLHGMTFREAVRFV